MSKKSSTKSVSAASKQGGKTQKSAANDKKPVYKQWWFWVIIVVILAAIGASSNNSSQNNGGNANNSQPSSQEKTEYATGEAATIDGQEVTVTSVERNYQTGNQYVQPSEGKEFVKVVLQIVNNSNDQVSYNAINVKIEEGDGSVHDYSSSVLAQADDSLGHGDIVSGGRKTGSVVFEVPAGDSGLKLHFKPSSWSSKELVIKL